MKGSLIITLVSSANNIIGEFLLDNVHGVTEGKSLIYIKKNNGPKTDPCGHLF
jgi:hypothetical protein